MRTKWFIPALAMMVATLVAAGPRDVAAQDAGVYVVHGIPGQDLGLDPALPVDVAVNGQCFLQGFMFGDVAGPVALPPGDYDIAISLADPDNPCSNPPVIEALGVPIGAGENVTLIAHLAEDGSPTATKFVNDVSPNAPGKARVIAHHTAAAPAVDIAVGRLNFRGNMKVPQIKIEDAPNGAQAAAEIRPGNWALTISPAGSPDPVFGPVSAVLKPNNAYLLYAVGTAGTDSFTILQILIGL
jgi:hypothetical protein